MAQRTQVDWPTCEQADCIGVRLDSARTCLAHCSSSEKAAALKLISEGGLIDVRGVVINSALLKEVLAAAPREENGKPLIKDCRFGMSTFQGDADFADLYGATFCGDADFGGATFNGDALFHWATFESAPRFRAATSSGDAEFGGATFHCGADFHGDLEFYGGPEFSGATFNGAADFYDATFSCNAWFADVTFNGNAKYSGATFNGYLASFERAAFNGDAGFFQTTFNGNAKFTNAIFHGDAKFDVGTFNGDAEFTNAIFHGDAEFGEATFNGYRASFDGAAFNGAAGFEAAIFGRVAEFAHVRFERERQFGPVLAVEELVLDDAQFMQPVQIEVSSARLRCHRARFPGGVQFRLRWACVVLDDTDLASPSILTGIPHLTVTESPHRSKELARREEQFVKAWEQELRGEISAGPQLLSLRRANVAGLGLSNVSAADCRFAGAHNLDKLRLESNVSFATAPPRALAGWRWSGREVIAEERAWRANRSRPRRWLAPWWPDWPYNYHGAGEPPDVLEPAQVAGLYRALRKGREDAKDEPGAADFYYGEMEMRRHARRSGHIPARGRVERMLLTAYWLVSGYGLRANRAVVWLAALTAALAFAFYRIGFAEPPHPDSYWTSLLYAFRATLSLTDNDIKLTAWGQLLQGVLRLTGPVLLGLALLALRGRVKR